MMERTDPVRVTLDAESAVATSLRNLGPRSWEWLQAIGIESYEDLDAIGSVEARRRLKERFPKRVTAVLLYALGGALLDLPWNDLPPEVVDRLDGAVGRVPRRRPAAPG